MRVAIGFLQALAIGIACRLAGLPLPATGLVGALLVLAMTLGSVVAERLAHRQLKSRPLYGGPTGEAEEVRS